MAVIRPTSPRLFRHFGSPEQAARPKVRSASRAVIGMLKLMAKRFLATVLLGWFVTLIVALIASPLVLWGWNSGVTPAFGARQINWFAAYFLSLFVSTFAGMFKSSLTVNSKEE